MVSPAPRPQITILTPVFNEEASLPMYEQTVDHVLLSRPDYDFRVLFIEDGSQDNSWKMLCEMCSRDARFEAIRLSRNYGSHIALNAGFAQASGDAIATLACDLQDPPEVILEFLDKWRDGAQIVWGHRRARQDQNWRVATSKLFYQLLKRFAMPPGSRFATGSYFLIDRQVADCFCQFQERNPITFALVAWTGFDQAVVEYDRKKRVAGKSGWNLSKMIKTMYDAFVGFSFLPVRLMTFAGLAAFFITILLGLYVFISWLTVTRLAGWTSIMLGLSFFFGIQFLLLGIAGEYLYRIYMEVVRRPLYFISDRAGAVKK
jgi:glycosyltransferase involved in cell wall biosynthesis